MAFDNKLIKNMAVMDTIKQHIWKPIVLALFIWLQYQLWFDETGLLANFAMEEKIENQTQINEAIEARNQVLAEEINEIKSGMDSIEAKARKELGMVKEGETFFIVVEPKPVIESRP